MQIEIDFLRRMASFAYTGDPLQSAVNFVERNRRSTGEDDARNTVAADHHLALPLNSRIRQTLGTNRQPCKESCHKKRQ